MRLTVVVISGVCALVGCATETRYQDITAAFTGCSADDVQISDVQTSGSNAWKAICRNDARIYRCTKTECIEVR